MMLDCAPNFRDLGGTALASGAPIRQGLLFRSEAITVPSAADCRRIGRMACRSVLDLRSREERDAFPSHWRSDDIVASPPDSAARASDALLTILENYPTAAGATEFMVEAYRRLPGSSAAALQLAFESIAKGSLPLLVHCAAGKDRTGVVIAIILLGLGASKDLVYTDYLASNRRLSPANRQASHVSVAGRLTGPLPEEAMAPILAVDRRYLDAALHGLNAEFGGIRSYLDAIDIGEAVRKTALERLTIEPPLDIQ